MADTEQQQQKLLGGKSTQLPFTVNALQVVVKRYLLKDHADNVLETPEEMFHRVAKALAEVEYKFDAKQEDVLRLQKEFYDLMASFSFTPAGRTLANAGGPTRLVSNCIVLHIQDSLDDIFETLKQAALLQKAGSGLGFPLHLMRPAGFITKTSYGVSSGPISFLHVYNTAFGVIKQQNRHGANMAVMRVDHPDILEFVHCKDREGDLRNFNVSVGLSDKFMRRVRSNDPRPWMCKFRGEKMLPRRVKRDANMSFLSATPVDLTAAAMFREIIEAAWRTGEPGCVFLDTVNRTNPLPGLGRLEACNPCGEQFLHDGDVCNLGALNLEKFVTADKKVDFAGLGRATRLAVRMLDNVIELSDFPVEKVHETFASNRRVGLGVMGFADMLYQLNVGYGTAEGRQVASDVMQCIQREAEAESRHLGETKGVFPNWEKSVFAKTGEKRRNAALTNIPPTGTISMMFDVSGGVEPYFALAYYYKNILGGAVQLSYVNKHLKRALVERGIFTEELLAEIIKRGSLQHIPSLPEDLRRTFVTSMDITAEDHIQMQAAFQKHTDNAISKTINFPNSATREDILCGYLSAWELGCKGCTVYRDGSRMEQVLNLNDKKDEKAKEANGHPNGNGVATNGHTNGNGAVKAKASNGTAGTVKGVCKDCNVNLISHEGCAECPQCGTSRCEG